MLWHKKVFTWKCYLRSIPPEPFNSLVRNGRVGEIIERILETIKPEMVYFTEQDGKRGGIFVVNVQTPSDVPAFAEPFFLNFEACCKFRILMSPEDLQKAGLEELGKKWGWYSPNTAIKWSWLTAGFARLQSFLYLCVRTGCFPRFTSHSYFIYDRPVVAGARS